LAVGVARGAAPFSVWGAAVEGKQGSPVPVKVVGGVFYNAIDGGKLDHMAVSDGVEVYDKVCKPPPDGLYVTSDIMKIYTGSAIRDAVAYMLTDTYQCPVTNMNGVAGSGKTYAITHEARKGDVVLSETRAALEDTAKRLYKLHSDWDGAAWTVDSFLMSVPRTKCNTLWIDESLRLHAGKVAAVIKWLKPVNVYCFGDSEQIPLLPFVPGFDFKHSAFPFDTVTTKKDTWRSPADVCFITSHRDYYGFHVMTHNPITRSMNGPLLCSVEVLLNKAPGVVVLTYTQIFKHDLLKAGVTNVMTIGESQGSTFEDVMLVRDSQLSKPLYFDKGQALVAITRHTRSFQYFTVAVRDDSMVARSLDYLKNKVNELLLASHSIAARQPAVVVTAARPATPEYDTEWADAEVEDSPGISAGYASEW